MSDHARPLNARGRTAAAALRVTFADLGLTPDLVLVSSARRTMQTLDALSPWEATPQIEPMDALYLAPASQLLSFLNQVSETVRCVLVVGHNPGLHELAWLLAGPQQDQTTARRQLNDGFPTGALAEFAIPGPWHSLGAGGGRLVRFVTPHSTT